MARRSPSALKHEARLDDLEPTRLCYRLALGGRGQAGRLLALRQPGESPIGEPELARLLETLHPLDLAIARELRSSTTYGQLAEGQIARLLPLLARRDTLIGEDRLRIRDHGLRPRVRVTPDTAGALRLEMGLRSNQEDWVDLSSGRLLAGSQAFFLRGAEASPVESPAPWGLAAWAKTQIQELDADLSPQKRDELARDLAQVGVPIEDLAVLAVRRAAPNHFLVTLNADPCKKGESKVTAVMEADYDGARVVLTSQRPVSPYLMPKSARGSLVERDLAAEHDVRQDLRRLGFRYDKDRHLFVGGGDVALRALDPHAAYFPSDWRVRRGPNTPQFHQDLSVRTCVRLDEDQGLLDLSFAVDVVDQGDSEQTAAKAQVELAELLKWLQSGSTYLRLNDGSFVSPSHGFRRSLRILDDLGAQSDRVLVSPLCVGLLRAIGDQAGLEMADAATKSWLEELTGAEQPQEVEPPVELAGNLRDYQRRGLDWLAMLHRHRVTGILADDMGLGKTIQALALLLAVRGQEEQHRPSLVVAPTSVVGVWRDEAQKFAPSLKVGVLHGPPRVRHQVDLDAFDLLITSYGVLRRDAERLSKRTFRYVLLDEAQAAKNAASQNARAIRQLKSERRLALTGTPIENRTEELWATFDFLAPGFLGNLRQFRKRYALPIDRGDMEARRLLRARIQPLVLRRLKDEVATELPPKLESLVRCDMHPAQRALYDHIARELREKVGQKVEASGVKGAHAEILAALTRLRQICCDPALLPVPDHIKTPPSAKLALFAELMREALASERRVLVFSQFVKMQKRLIATIRELGVDPLWLHGGTRNRDRVVKGFQDPEGPPVIVVSLRAGGTGITLTRADTVMHYDPWWNPAVERQATDRTHRLGQRQQVTVYKMVCTDSVEERVLALASKKDRLARALLTSDGRAQKRITAEEVLALLN